MNVADGKADLFALFAADPESNPSDPVEDLTYVNQVYRGETRAGQTLGPIAITTFHTGGDATELLYNLNVYAKPDANVLDVQDQLDQTIDEVNALLLASATFGSSSWTCGYDRANDVLVASWQIDAGRTDF